MSYLAIRLTQQPIRRPSLSPNDAGCQVLLVEHLQAIDLTVERMGFADIQNFWVWCGQDEMLAFAGHTDAVSPGDTDCWIDPPFKPTIYDNMLFGRGTAGAKGSLTAMVVTAERFVAQHPNRTGRLASLITFDEEANAHNGMVKTVEVLMTRDERFDYCLAGELLSIEVVGDVVKGGRHGSLTCNLTTHGVQGHVAYLHLADNPAHHAALSINELVATKWDQGNESFPATSMQIVNIQVGTGSNDVIPGGLFMQFNFHFNTKPTDETIGAQVLALLEKYRLRYTVSWWLSGQSFSTTHGKLVDTVVSAVEHYSEIKPQLLTTGGTSGGRLIARTGVQVVELGLVNATIRKTNECVNAADLQLLVRMYQHIIEQLVA